MAGRRAAKRRWTHRALSLLVRLRDPARVLDRLARWSVRTEESDVTTTATRTSPAATTRCVDVDRPAASANAMKSTSCARAFLGFRCSLARNACSSSPRGTCAAIVHASPVPSSAATCFTHPQHEHGVRCLSLFVHYCQRSLLLTCTADCPASSASHVRVTPTPSGVTAPRPVTTTRRVGAGGGAENASCANPRRVIDVVLSIFGVLARHSADRLLTCSQSLRHFHTFSSNHRAL